MSAIPQSRQAILTALYRGTALYGDTALLGGGFGKLLHSKLLLTGAAPVKCFTA